MIAERKEVRFPSDSGECAAWLYRPAAHATDGFGRLLPVVVMGHGLGATRELCLDSYARRFAEAGLAVLAFDYRHFGASSGEPRQLICIRRQLADWAAAVAFARRLPGIDRTRVALWGTSFGGGHAIVAAARDPLVAAVVAQCPFTDGPASVRALGLASVAGVARLAVRDAWAAFLGRQKTVRVPLVGPPGTAALMAARDAERGYRALIPDGLVFDGTVAARIGLSIGLYRPGRLARKVRCPILFCVSDRDSVAPAEPTLRYAQSAPLSTVVRYDIGHFDIYHGAPFERACRDQVSFLLQHLTESEPRI